MSKQGSASKWNGGRARTDERMVEDDRSVKLANGQWRRKQDECSEHDYIERRKERAGFHRGARVRLHYKGAPIVFDGVKR